MEFIVPAIIILFVLIRTFMSATKGKSGTRQRPSNRSGGGFSPFIDDVRNTIREQVNEAMGSSGQSTEGYAGQQSASRRTTARRNTRGSSPPPLPANRPVSYTEALEPDHFSETELVKEYQRRHRQGKTLRHHTHDYFDPEKDQSKGRALEAKRKRAATRKALLKTKNIKHAIIMKQILDRPDF